MVEGKLLLVGLVARALHTMGLHTLVVVVLLANQDHLAWTVEAL